jgi:hypothetical protein
MDWYFKSAYLANSLLEKVDSHVKFLTLPVVHAQTLRIVL